MGLIKAVVNSVGKGLGEQWKEVLEAGEMSGTTVFTKGVPVRTDGSNTKGSSDIVSDGSTIHVYPNQFMMLVDGGKVVDYTAEEGYYTVSNSSAPSLFNGQFADSLKNVFGRIAYGGTNPQKQQVFFINLQEIKGIKFGTPNPLNYFDAFYNSELFVKSFGEYSIKITNPLLFYEQVIPKNTSHVDIDEVNDQYLSEFLQAFAAALNQMSAEGKRISYLASQAPELSKHMQSCLDEDWNQNRGFEVDHVGVSSISYTKESQDLINMRNQAAMLSDPSIRETYVQTSIAQGIKSAGANESGAGAAFMGVGMGLNAMGGLGTFSQTNAAQMQQQAAQQQQAAAMAAAPAGWTCECGAAGQQGNFCSACGKPKPEPAAPAAAEGQWFCPQCGTAGNGNFCPKCGTAKPNM